MTAKTGKFFALLGKWQATCLQNSHRWFDSNTVLQFGSPGVRGGRSSGQHTRRVEEVRDTSQHDAVEVAGRASVRVRPTQLIQDGELHIGASANRTGALVERDEGRLAGLEKGTAPP